LQDFECVGFIGFEEMNAIDQRHDQRTRFVLVILDVGWSSS